MQPPQQQPGRDCVPNTASAEVTALYIRILSPEKLCKLYTSPHKPLTINPSAVYSCTAQLYTNHAIYFLVAKNH